MTETTVPAKIHLALATPMHSDLCNGTYFGSVRKLDHALINSGSRLTHLKLGNESHIQRARNTLAWHYRDICAHDDAPPSHLLFCDGDQGFMVPDLARMIAADKDILVAPVPMKQLDWEAIHKAALAGVPADKLHRYSGRYNIVHKPGVPLSPHKPFEIKRGGTGFMLIKRQVFDILAKSGIVETYGNDCPGDSVMPMGTEIYNFFPSPVKDNHLLTEDFGFCDLWTQVGGEIYAAPWCRMVHVGAFRFEGCYADRVWDMGKADGFVNEDGTVNEKAMPADGGENGPLQLRGQSECERASDAA